MKKMNWKVKSRSLVGGNEPFTEYSTSACGAVFIIKDYVNGSILEVDGLIIVGGIDVGDALDAAEKIRGLLERQREMFL